MPLHALARTFTRAPERKLAPSTPRKLAPEYDDRPGSDYNARASWDNVLVPHGWTLLYSRGEITYWRRPGKDDGQSATTNYAGSDLLYVFTSSTAFNPEHAYDKFGAFALLNHGGDISSAARELRAGGYGAPLVGNFRDRGRIAPPRPGGTWETPVPLSLERDLPDFPVDVLPPVLAEFICALAEFTQTPPDAGAMIALAALSAAVSGRLTVEPRRKTKETTNIYAVVSLPPAARKSAVVKAIVAPLREFESEERERSKTPRLVAKARRDIAKERASTRRKQAARELRGDSQQELEDEAVRAAQAAAEIVVPAEVALFVDDITPEALGAELAAQGERIAFIKDEGGIFEMMAGRYTGSANFDIYLNAHSGEPYLSNRISRKRVALSRPVLTMGLAVQPAVIEALAENKKFAGKGLLARFLYSLPGSLVGRRIDGPDIPDAARDAYHQCLRAIATTFWPMQEPAHLSLSDDALELQQAWGLEIESKLGVGRELHEIEEWAGKLPWATTRLNALLHVAERIDGDWQAPIGREDMWRGIAIGEYLIPHALHAFDVMATNEGMKTACILLDWVRGGQKETFTLREGQRENRRIRSTDQMMEGVQVLLDHGWIRHVADCSLVTYEVNPVSFARV